MDTENERKKAYLRQYKHARDRCEDIELEITRLRLDKMFPSPLFDGMPHGTAGGDLSGYAATLDNMIEKLKRERYKKITTQQNIMATIDTLEDEDEKRVLRLRYIGLLSWEKIALRMNYAERQIYYIHGHALEHLRVN